MNIFKDMKITCCPHCKNKRIVKYGKYNKRQRYKCLECYKTFTSYTKKPWSYTKKPLFLWKKYINIMPNHCLLEISSLLQINIASAFSWRHKILTFWKENNKNILRNNIGIQNRPLKENRKGSRNPYIPANKLSLTIAIDSFDNYSMKIHYTQICIKLIHNFIAKNIHPYSIILRSNNRYIQVIRKNFNKSKKIYNNKIPDIFSYYNNFLSWIGYKFKGVATKNLRLYISWYSSLFQLT
ncbi:MAG: IS1 family transposase [Clostridiales bacterium]|nr:IS1 family transposase [Clostridiales bacterium]